MRRNFPSNALLSTGAYVVWAHRPHQHQQLDCTPLSRIDAIPGLTGSYYNSTLRGVTEPDWTATRTRSGVRVDDPPDFPTDGWGERSEVGLTGGSDENWDGFSVQWDGFLRVNRPVRIATRSDDGSRLWVDVSGDGNFQDATELFDNTWGTGHAATTGTFSSTLSPGLCQVRIQYEEGNGGNTFQLVQEDRGDGDFDLYQDEAQTSYGLTANFVDSSLRAVAAQDDWTTTQTTSGTRNDPIPVFWDNTMGERSTVGITGGSDGNWQNYSVQYDGWLAVHRPTRFLGYGADGTRFWIDMDNNAAYGTSAPEHNAGTWGSGGDRVFTGFSDWVQPGSYRVRLQHEQDTDGGNRSAFMGQNDLQTSLGRGIHLGGAGKVTAPAGSAVCGNFTVEAWVRPADTAGYHSIFSSRAASANYGFTIKIVDGSSVLGHIGSLTGWLAVNASVETTIRTGEWLHVAYAVSPSGYTIYLNGWEATSGSLSGTPLLFDATHPLTIGADPGAVGGESFRGDIDEVRVRNTTRTGEPISGDITIQGNGADRLQLAGTNARSFTVTSAGTLTLRGLSIVSGAIGGAAGAIGNNGGTVVLEDCIIRNCRGSRYFGGACFNSGSFTARRCLFIDNQATGGRGEDRGAGSSGGGGGAIFHHPDALLLACDLSFLDNSSSTPGAEDANDLQAATGLMAGFNFEHTPASGCGDATGNSTADRFVSPAVDLASENNNAFLRCNVTGSNQHLRLVTTSSPGNSTRDLGLQGSFTAVARIRPANTSGDKVVFGQSGPDTGGALHMGLRDGMPLMGFSGNELAGTTSVPADQWTHLAFVYDEHGGLISVYVNGELEAAQLAIDNVTKDADLLLGWSEAIGGANHFVGDLDDVLVFCQALSAGQITSLATAPPISAADFPLTLVPCPALPLPVPLQRTWSVRELRRSGAILNTLTHADWVHGNPGSATGETYFAPVINFADPDTSASAAGQWLAGHVPFATDTPGGDNDFTLAARTRLHIVEEDDYTFGFSGDDGMRLRIRGAVFHSSTRVNAGNAANPAHRGDTLSFPNPTGRGETLGVAHLLPGTYDVEFLWFERGGGAWTEAFAARGAKTAMDATFRPLTEFSFDAESSPEHWITLTDDDFIVSWYDKPGWVFETSTTYDVGSWTEIPFTPAALGGLVELNFPLTASRRFVRLKRP